MDIIDDMDVNNKNTMKVPMSNLAKSDGSSSQHQRSYSTDVHRKKPLKLQEWKSKCKNSKSSSNTLNKKSFKALQKKGQTSKYKKIHKMDFNLYDIEVKPNRRYRLIDGRIGIAKYKGKTAFGKGTETYIGILVEHGEGIHNGTVRGKTYFRCKDGKGDMVHPYAIIEDLGLSHNYYYLHMVLLFFTR